MTIGQLKKHIKSMPDDAEAVFSLWCSDDKYHHYIIHATANNVKPIKTGGNVAIVGRADDCRADMMIKNEDGTFSY